MEVQKRQVPRRALGSKKAFSWGRVGMEGISGTRRFRSEVLEGKNMVWAGVGGEGGPSQWRRVAGTQTYG